MKVNLQILLIITISCFLLFGVEAQAQHGKKPGRKIRLSQYEIQFGTWPLMEITKLGKSSSSNHYYSGTKSTLKRPSIGGFIQNAIQSNIKSPLNGIKIGNFPHVKFNGPPPSYHFKQGFHGPPSKKPQFFASFKPPHGSGPPPPPPQFSSGPPPPPPQFSSGPPPPPPQFSSGPPPLPQFSSGPPQFSSQGPPQFVPQGPPSPYSSPSQGPPPKPFTPNGPPPPPGFTKQPNQNQPIRVFIRNPSQGGPIKIEGSSLTIPSESNKVSFSSVMGKAAYSGFFDKNLKNFNSFSNSFPPGPPTGFSSNPIIIRGPPQSQFSSPSMPPNQFVNAPFGFKSLNFGAPQTPVMGPPTASSRFDMDKVPKVPPVIKIGNHPPEGYSMSHGEQQFITLKLPNVRMNKKMDSETLLRGAEYKFSSDLFNRRQDPFNNFNLNSKPVLKFKKEEKKLPDVGAIYTVNMVLQTPNISAPMNGSDSPHFQQGMEDMHRIYGNNKQSPLDSQVKLLGKLFTELQRLKSPKISVPDVVNTYRRDGDGNIDFDGVNVEPQKPKVDAPLMAVHIQSYSIPEPGSSDPDIIESSRLFGLQGHKFEFGNTNEIINLMDTAQKAVNARIPVNELGNNRREVNHNLQEWIKSYVTLTRKINHEAHAKGENIANKSFKQGQLYMPNGPQSQPMDPKIFNQGASITNAGAVATFQG